MEKKNGVMDLCHPAAMLVKDNISLYPEPLVDAFGSKFKGCKTKVFSPSGLKMVAM